MRDTPWFKSHPPGRDALTAPWQSEQDSFSRRVGLHEQPAAPPSMVWVPGAGCMPIAPLGFQQQLRDMLKENRQACIEVKQALALHTAAGQSGQQLSSAPGPSPQPQLPQPQPPIQLRQPERLADGTVHSIDPALMLMASPIAQRTAAAPGPGLPKLSVYKSLQQLCEAWFMGQSGIPSLKNLQQGQRGDKQRWSEISSVMEQAAKLLQAGGSLAEAVQELETERVSLENQRFDQEAEKFRQQPKGKAPKQPPLTVAGFVRHKTNKRSWV